ncbi:MAG: serine/threonine protein kinase, partial [Myxococcota bacterium]|nr:serine/threonine protein kinase [Myxococcota bacterium]
MSTSQDRIVGNYVIGTLLGTGGAGHVFAARHRFLQHEVAIKIMREDRTHEPAEAQAFLAEAAGTRSIDHPNVVHVSDFGRDDLTGCCYLVMERIAGEDLASRLRRERRLAEPTLRRLGAAIADGMQAAHDRGIVHRDLKPANVMLAGDVPKIVDFGIAKFLGTQAAMTTSRRIGTIEYMAPEQLTGGTIAPSVDIWALGVLLFAAATGRLPFEHFEDGRCPQLFDLAPRARTIVPALSPALDALLARCLDKDPGRRPRTMAEVADQLRTDDASERFTEDAGPLPVATVLPTAATSARDEPAPRSLLTVKTVAALTAFVALAVGSMLAIVV